MSKEKKKKMFFDFMGVSKAFAVVSLVLTVASLIFIVSKGFNFGIDFAGGTEFQVQFKDKVETSKIRQFADDLGLKGSSVQSIGEDEKEFLLRVESTMGENDKETNKLINQTIDKVTTGLKSTFPSLEPLLRRVDSVGPQIGDELKRDGLLAIFYSLILILIYVGLRFDFKFAPGAVFCLFHDAVITLGIFALFQREVNIQTLAAILTIIGYSLNDTIVTFDRIRENELVMKGESFVKKVNQSLNEVLSRTLLTSITTMLAVAAMYIFGTGVIRDFAFTLGIGVLVGTYSSIFVASPLTVFVDKLQASK